LLRHTCYTVEVCRASIVTLGVVVIAVAAVDRYYYTSGGKRPMHQFVLFMHNVLSLCPCTAFETKAEFEAFIGPSIDFYENSALFINIAFLPNYFGFGDVQGYRCSNSLTCFINPSPPLTNPEMFFRCLHRFRVKNNEVYQKCLVFTLIYPFHNLLDLLDLLTLVTIFDCFT